MCGKFQMPEGLHPSPWGLPGLQQGLWLQTHPAEFGPCSRGSGKGEPRLGRPEEGPQSIAQAGPLYSGRTQGPEPGLLSQEWESRYPWWLLAEMGLHLPGRGRLWLPRGLGPQGVAAGIV